MAGTAAIPSAELAQDCILGLPPIRKASAMPSGRFSCGMPALLLRQAVATPFGAATGILPGIGVVLREGNQRNQWRVQS